MKYIYEQIRIKFLSIGLNETMKMCRVYLLVAMLILSICYSTQHTVYLYLDKYGRVAKNTDPKLFERIIRHDKG